MEALICIKDNRTIESYSRTLLETSHLDPATFEKLILALSETDNEDLTLNAWYRFTLEHPAAQMESNDILEKVCWCVINKASKNPSPILRQISTLAAVIGNDAKGVEILQSRINDPNCAIRASALKLAGHLYDMRIQEQVMNSIRKEKSLPVRISAIEAAGKMKLYDAKIPLFNLLADQHTALQEKLAAVAAIVNIYNTVEEEQISRFANSNQTGFTSSCLCVDETFS